LAAKQYCSLCLSQGYENLVSAPDYFYDKVVTVLPALFLAKEEDAMLDKESLEKKWRRIFADY
jgi:hypothetical protein